MLMTAVSGIDNRNRRFGGGNIGCAFFWMSHCADICVTGNNTNCIGNTFTLGRGTVIGGDLKFGRTVHSLINALSRYEGIRFILISPPELKVPDYIKESVLDAKNIEYRETTSLDDAIADLDILYMTRVQKERFFNEPYGHIRRSGPV